MWTIILDSSPLGAVTKRRGIAEAEACRDWVRACRTAGHRIIVPAIAYYEVARELRRADQTTAMQRLDAFSSVPGVYLPISDSALRLAVQLWSDARKAGRPTADPKELDCDVLIAAQAIDLEPNQDRLFIATNNVGHLSQFVTAKPWFEIEP